MAQIHRKPTENIEIFKRRRQRVTKSMGPNSALIVAANPEFIRNDDVHYPYRQDSNFYYLTGFEEPESMLILRPGQKPESIMFVREKNMERETWDGFRFGPEGTKNEFGIDEVWPMSDFSKKSVELLKGFDEVYYRLFKNNAADILVQNLLLDLKRVYGRSGYGLLTIKDADTFLGEFRLKKDDDDLKNQRKACEISATAHLKAMKSTRPGVSERQIQGLLTAEFYTHGSAREGYGFIVASGNNATTLHYNFNDQICESGELLLIDAGCEFNFYSGDITRTYPVNGRFSPAQKKVYEGVLKIQKDIINYIKPGIYFKDLHAMGVDMLTQLMLDLGLVSGRKEDVISSLEYKKYYPHGIGHWLGMDVHDAGLYMIRGEARPIEAGMVFTVEPGIYIPATDKSAPAEYRGIGIRIEDNILVTQNGCEVLTAGAPKEVSEIEAIVGSNK